MSQPLEIGSIEINLDTRLGRMLAAGRLTATMRSKRTDQHITLTFQSKAKKSGKWESVPFADATHVFIKMGLGEWGSTKIGTYYPNTGKLYFDTRDKAWMYAARQTLYSATTGVSETEQFEISEMNFCGVCGKELTNDTSIKLGIGPTCEEKYYGTVTPRSQHYTQMAENLVERVRETTQPTKVYENVENAETPVFRAMVEPVTDKRGREVPRTFEALAAAVKR